MCVLAGTNVHLLHPPPLLNPSSPVCLSVALVKKAAVYYFFPCTNCLCLCVGPFTFIGFVATMYSTCILLAAMCCVCLLCKRSFEDVGVWHLYLTKASLFGC